MDRFSKYNPKAVFLFFVFVIVLSLLLFHPVFLAISFMGSFLYKLKLDGKFVFSYFFKFILPLILLTAVFNFLFTHYGQTILFNLFEMNFTFEGLFYGFCQGVMLGTVIMWFSAYSKVMTADKLLCVFGRFLPNTALIFSMVLGFIPRLKKNIAEISDARLLIKNDESKLKKSISSFSALITMTLEESISLSDSMKARGFGKGRTVYSKYRFSYKDFFLAFGAAVLAVTLMILKIKGKTEFIFEPVMYMQSISVAGVLLFALLTFLPLIIDLAEDMKWHFLKQKI